MNLCIFDLDGTLCHLRGGLAEDGNFRAAVQATFGEVEVNTDWHSYPHVSDHGIVASLYEIHLGRAPSVAEHEAVCSAYLARVQRAVERGETRIEVTAGAREAVAALPREHGWDLALATGGWRRVALYKLRLCDLDLTGRAQAFAEDGPSRETISRTALERAQHQRSAPFERIVYVGDAAWDARTCANLGWAFVGIATGDRAQQLRALGASHVLPDMSDCSAFVDALDHARAPTSAQHRSA